MKARTERRIDKQGRVILPSHIRRALNLTTDSVVTIEMTEAGNILVKPAEERCCICGKALGSPRVAIDTWNGQKKVCKQCANLIAYCTVQIAKEA